MSSPEAVASPAVLRPWQADASLSELSLYADWDSVTGMILSLRIHAFEHGTIPVWNFLFCGGRPELAVPFSWAWTWPSLFAYALSPNYAILAVWIVLTAVGFAATRALLLRDSGSGFAASVGAAIYAGSGLFAARFNAGHVTFAFFHLLPVLMLAFEALFARRVAGRAATGHTALVVLASAGFASAALPHGLIHFFPAFVALVAVRVVVAAHEHGWRTSLGAASVAVSAQLLGFWLAAYKLWPVARWQLGAPREDVRSEAYGLGEVMASSLSFVPDYFQIGRGEAWHVFSSWEYNAFVGPIPWLLAVVAFAGWRGADARRRGAIAYGLVLAVAGILLCLGNGNPWSPAAWFAGWPLFDGVRAFSRFQILLVFGLAVLACHGIAVLERRLSHGARSFARAAVAVGVLAPLAAQAGFLIWNVHAAPNDRILARYPAAGSPSDPPVGLRTHGQRLREPRHETALLDAGHWIASCSSRLNLPAPEPYLTDGRAPLSIPSPTRIAALSASHLALEYDAGTRGVVALNLRRPDSMEFDAPELRVRDRSAFDLETLADHTLGVSVRDPGPIEGAWASVLGLAASALFLVWLRRGPRRR